MFIPTPASSAPHGQHLIVVDDHPSLARVSARLLETFGYRTSVFLDPRVALDAFRASPAEFDAVLTDLSMPQMRGEDFISALRDVRPELPIVVASGGSAEDLEAMMLRLHVDAVLLKPWRLEEALSAFRRAFRAH